jgi:hypothetical protein
MEFTEDDYVALGRTSSHLHKVVRIQFKTGIEELLGLITTKLRPTLK